MKKHLEIFMIVFSVVIFFVSGIAIGLYQRMTDKSYIGIPAREGYMLSDEKAQTAYMTTLRLDGFEYDIHNIFEICFDYIPENYGLKFYQGEVLSEDSNLGKRQFLQYDGENYAIGSFMERTMWSSDYSINISSVVIADVNRDGFDEIYFSYEIHHWDDYEYIGCFDTRTKKMTDVNCEYCYYATSYEQGPFMLAVEEGDLWKNDRIKVMEFESDNQDYDSSKTYRTGVLDKEVGYLIGEGENVGIKKDLAYEFLPDKETQEWINYYASIFENDPEFELLYVKYRQVITNLKKYCPDVAPGILQYYYEWTDFMNVEMEQSDYNDMSAFYKDPGENKQEIVAEIEEYADGWNVSDPRKNECVYVKYNHKVYYVHECEEVQLGEKVGDAKGYSEGLYNQLDGELYKGPYKNAQYEDILYFEMDGKQYYFELERDECNP